MKSSLRVAVVMTLALLAASAVAQVNGVPASVTSVGTPGRGFAPGVPASVTSLGPFGWTTPPNCCPGATPLIPAAMGMRPPFFNVDVGSQGLQLGRQHHLRVRGGAPYVLPYPYPVGYPAAYPMYTDQAPVDEEDEEDAEPPAPTIFEHRRTSQWRAVEPALTPQSQPAPTAAAEPQPAREQEPTLLVFKDGRQVEILNFAIAGDTLYELSPEYHKIPLTELDVPATVRANDARGTEFHVPPQKGS